MPQKETREIFRKCVGQILRIDGFDQHGHLEVNVLDDGTQSPDYCAHTIRIEPEFVQSVP
ncbi:MAG: hypothetical protein C5B50_21595 [Verrucomicrobia bacterium]|nr:MAG: hypothetical protein C5B50_21595 [Verrucomicrobiota bacterium]